MRPHNIGKLNVGIWSTFLTVSTRYNGRATGPPDPFPPALEEACRIVEKVVNEEMHKRQRYPLEWAGEVDGDENRITDHVLWRANVAAANCYEGAKESVGPHSDQLTYLGPYPTIASLSLGRQRFVFLTGSGLTM